MNTPSTRFHLDKPNGKVLGVCAGIARYTGVDVLWVRVATAVLTLAGFGLVIPAYILIGIFAASSQTH